MREAIGILIVTTSLLVQGCSGGTHGPVQEPEEGPAPAEHQTVDAEPVSQEQKVVSVLVEALDGDDAKRQERAAVALGYVGPGPDSMAVGHLRHAVKVGALPIQRAAVIALGRMGASDDATLALLIEKLDSGPLQQEAYTALGLIGEDAAAAVPTLTRHLSNALPDKRSVIADCMDWGVDKFSGTRNDAAWALENIGAGAAPGLVKTVEESAGQEAGKRAACVLVLMGSLAIPQLQGLMESDEARVRLLGASIAGSMDAPEGGEVLQAPLMKLMEDDDAGVRREAAAALGVLGLCDGSVPERLHDALKDQDDRVRGAAASSLFSCTGETKSTIPPLVKDLGDEDPVIRVAAATTLGSMGKAAQKAKGPLHKRLGDPDPRVVLASAMALQRITPGHKKAVKSLLGLCEHPEPSIRVEAEEALVLLGPESKFAVPLLIDKMTAEPDALQEMLKLPDAEGGKPSWPGSMHYVQDALVAIGAPSVGALLDLYGGKHLSLRSVALDLLGRIGPDASKAIPVVIESLAHGDEYQRMFRMSVLARIGPGDPRVVEALSALLQDPSEDVRMQALMLLGQMGEAASAAAPGVESLLDGHGRVVVVAAEASHRMGVMDDASFMQVLRDTLEQGDCAAREEATRALDESGLDGAELTDPLLLVLMDEQCSFDGHLLSLISRPECADDDTVSRLLDLVLCSKSVGQVHSYARALAAIIRNPK